MTVYLVKASFTVFCLLYYIGAGPIEECMWFNGANHTAVFVRLYFYTHMQQAEGYPVDTAVLHILIRICNMGKVPISKQITIWMKKN